MGHPGNLQKEIQAVVTMLGCEEQPASIYYVVYCCLVLLHTSPYRFRSTSCQHCLIESRSRTRRDNYLDHLPSGWQHVFNSFKRKIFTEARCLMNPRADIPPRSASCSRH